MPIEFDETKWPIVICKAVGDSTDEDISTYTQVLRSYLDRREHHVVVVDARNGKSLNSRHRRQVAEWNKANARSLSVYRGALILVTPSTLLRGMITAVYWLFPPPFSYRAVETMEDAISEAQRTLNRVTGVTPVVPTRAAHLDRGAGYPRERRP